jgi:hypothetical protein
MSPLLDEADYYKGPAMQLLDTIVERLSGDPDWSEKDESVSQ